METGPFGKLMPGLDMLKTWVASAGSSMPTAGAWMAPTLDPEELGKRIEELRTVQYWLEQNARLLATTIQTLEVQRMTLATLHKMNVPMADLGDAFKVPVPDTAAAPSWPPRAAPAAPAADEPAAPTAAAPAAEDPAPAAGAAPGPAGLVDPMQWWGALTQQFTEIAGRVVQDGAAAVKRPAEPPSAPVKRAAKPRKTSSPKAKATRGTGTAKR